MERKDEKEKVKAHRKRSGGEHPAHSTRRETLPTPPPDPTIDRPVAVDNDGSAAPPGEASSPPCDDAYNETDPFKRLFTYKEREAKFLRFLCEESEPGTTSRKVDPADGQPVPPVPPVMKEQPDGIGGSEPCFESANDFLMLLNRSGPSVAAALSTKDAIDQLDRLHELIGQFLTVQEQNMRMHWQLKNVETLRKLKLMQTAIAKDSESFICGSGQQTEPDHPSDNDLLDNEIEQNLALLETILAAGNTASSKRSSSKRERSKSVINDEIGAFPIHGKETSGRNYPLRRQSAISDFKPKVSKWTKVKAAFKWEKTSALPANEIKSSEAMMIPVNNEVARYLRVPSIPCVGSSGDSVFSSSSGIVVSGGSAPGTPGENSLASSAENLTDLNEEPGVGGGTSGSSTARDRHGSKRDSVKSISERGSQEEDARRSRSLDGEAILDPIRQMADKNKNKSAWSKVKGIVKNHRGSLKSNESRRNVAKASNSVGCSREASPCESMDACELTQRDRSDSFSSSQTSPGHRTATTPTFLLLPGTSGGDTSAPSGPNSPCGSIPTAQIFSSGDDTDCRPTTSVECGRTQRSGSGDKGVPTSASHPGTSAVAPLAQTVTTAMATATTTTTAPVATSRSSRKSKHIPDIESVPEGIPVSSSISRLRKSPPKPLSLRQEAIDLSPVSDGHSIATTDAGPSSLSLSSSPGPRHSPKRKSGAGLSHDTEPSLPASPSAKHFTFFGAVPNAERGADVAEGEYSSGDVSDQNTPKRRPSPKHRTLQRQREEIERRYQELQQKLQREFDAKQLEWERMRPAAMLLNTSPLHQLLKDAESTGAVHGAPSSSKAQPPPIVEDNLTPDFKKKLSEWRSKHQPQSSKESTEGKKKPITDWQLWKTGQIKLEGQGLKQLPDAKDLPEDFQKKLSEWKQMKAANKVPSYSTQSSQVAGGFSGASEGSMKRHQTKSSTGTVKKSKTSDELERDKHHHQHHHQQQQQQHKAEGLSKLKALVSTSDAPKKELVVQTTKGFIKFEGISRKFTRKLFEWEKAKNIAPEASTIALLHPGYAPVVVENRGVLVETKREKSPALVRSLSMDSIAPNPSASSISHQPSSLSLNDADELKDADKDSGSNRRVSSNPELELASEREEREEPSAVLVEVEDEVLEVADPLMPAGTERRPSTTLSPNQKDKEPGYKSSRPSSNSSTILKDSTKLLIRLSEQDSVDRDEVRRLKIVLRALIATLPEFVETGSRNSIAFFAYMKDLALDVLRHLHRFDDGTLKDAGEVLVNVQTINGLVAELKKSLHAYMKYATSSANGRNDEEMIPQISITPAAFGAQATSSIQRTDDSFRSMATINVTPTFVCNAVRVKQVDVMHPTTPSTRFPVSSESDPVPPTSPDSSAPTPDLVGTPAAVRTKESPDRDAREGQGKKLQRNLSNGSRRKTRIKRMGSRQSSKTESDSDDSAAQAYVLDVPRKAKRKTSRAKKPSFDSTEQLVATGPSEKQPPTEDVVYVLKIKPGQKIEQVVEHPQPQNASIGPSGADEGGVLISPQETCVELVEVVPSVTVSCTASVLVKTKRKLYTTVEGDGSLQPVTSGNQKVAISQELESGSGASDRNEAEVAVCPAVVGPSVEPSNRITNLPPLPQSPGMQRRLEGLHQKAPNKELSPNIRLMIAKYNQRLTTEKTGTSPHSSGSCSPVAWRSPVLDRRVRKQTEKYQETIQLSKSASAGSIRKSLRQLEEGQKGDSEESALHTPGVGATGAIKSSSTSKIEGTVKDDPTMDNSKTKEDSPELATFLAYDSLRRRDTLSRLEDRREAANAASVAAAAALASQTESPNDNPSVQVVLASGSATGSTGTIRKERLYKKRTESPNANPHTSASASKVMSRGEKYTRCRSVPNEDCVTEVFISSKALKPPSPRLIARRRHIAEQRQQRTDCSQSAPTTPLEEHRGILVPMSQRALKLKKAKEEFLRAPSTVVDRSTLSTPEPVVSDWSNRMSQISATSTASSVLDSVSCDLQLMKSASAGVIGDAAAMIDHGSALLRNESGSSCVESGVRGGSVITARHSISSVSASGGGGGGSSTANSSGRFGGLSNLASKLRKVKLRRSSKDLSKMHAVSALCRQSLMVDISGEASRMGSAHSLGVVGQDDAPDGSVSASRNLGEHGELLKKSGSVQAICNRFRRTGERNDELKKSRSLGFLEPDRTGSG
ncbi:uncharacterized protein LOC126573522 isoform X2 [Anopheles aquasalis]|uniref:uncharacterized protein LOC126573522 isoform X2 n=1 Tax=Anopheles aquasalis TaxID=42839 RepID=UPI00215A3A0B|nr:uncharacterized protein LOC126573522 isoform X2 [Anopheles aquasalis]